MEQDNFSIVYKKPKKYKKRKYQKGGLRLDNEASLKESYDNLPEFVKNVSNYFRNTDFKKDFKTCK